MRRDPGIARRHLLGRAPEADDVAQARHPRREVGIAEPQRELRGGDQHLAFLLVDLLLQHVVLEGMMQRQRAAAEQPHRERGGEASERHRRERRHHGRALLDVGFQRHREPAGDQAEMRPRHRAKAFRGDVEGDHRRLAAVLDHGARGAGRAGQHVVERGHALGQVGAETADVTDREGLRGGMHREVGIADAVDLAHGDDGARRGAVQRGGQFRMAPEQRQHGDDEPGAMRGEHCQHELDRSRQLDRDDGIGRQARFDEMRRQGLDGGVGLGVGHPPRLVAGHAGLVEGIEQSGRVRLPHQRALKQRVERRRYGWLIHGVTSLAAAPSTTRSPAGSRTARWPLAVLSDSSARSIARIR